MTDHKNQKSNSQNISNFAGANFLQSKEWAILNENSNNTRPHLIQHIEKDAIRSQALCFADPVFLPSGKKLPLINKISCCGGPLLSNTEDKYSFEVILKKIIRLAYKNISLQVHIDLGSTNPLNTKDFTLPIFNKQGFSKTNWATFHINLQKDEELLWSGINQKARNKVRKAENAKLNFIEITSAEDYIEKCFPIHNTTGIKQINKKNIKLNFSPKIKDCYSFYLVTDQKGRPLATAGSYHANAVSTRIASAISPICYKERIPAQDFLTWKSILHAKQLGSTIYDMAGANPSPATPKEKNIKSFKAKWGGELIKYGIYKKPIWPFLNSVKQFVFTLRR